MEDEQIVRLFFARDQQALAQAQQKYGAYLQSVALNILSDREDASECVSSAFFKAWEAIPPAKPQRLGAWLGRVVRNIALNMYQKQHSQKRYAGMNRLLDELGECVPSGQSVEQCLEQKQLTQAINRWLAGLEPCDRRLFVRRYWYGDNVSSLAHDNGWLPQKTAKRLYTLRQSLRRSLEEEGFYI